MIPRFDYFYRILFSLLFFFETFFLIHSARAQQDQPLEKLVITGEMEDFVVNTSVPHKISKEKLDLYKYTDVNRTLKQSAGVYVREEDGQGLRPNIGLRGTNPDRSKKIVFMEDGVLAGPAPYSAPAAYYTPSMLHTESLEVYKGFTAVPYGPNSIGGTLNYLSHSIPRQSTTSGDASWGAFNTQIFKLSHGQSFDNWGYSLLVGRNSSDGFKKLDGGGDVGFVKNDLSTKLKWSQSKHKIELRFGFENEDSRETYLGLSPSDIQSNPYRRYRASKNDQMKWQHSKVHFEHIFEASPAAQLKTTIYRNDFERTWFRADSFKGSSFVTNLPSFYDVLNNPTIHQQYYDVLTGAGNSSAASDGSRDLILLDNQRTFYSQGAQTRWNFQYEWSAVKHDLEFGLRFHQDQIRRTHNRYISQMEQGQLLVPSAPSSLATMNSNSASALSFYFIENMSWDKWVLTVLTRLERVNFEFNDTKNNSRLDRNDSVFAPGAALLYKITDLLSIKGSVNRGVSVAGLSDAGTEAQERSLNYEAGLKWIASDAQTHLELVGFYNDYSNITGTCTASTGCSESQLDQQFNGGKALIQGIEARLSHQFFWKTVKIPVQWNATFINAEFKSDFLSNSAEWGTGTVRAGDPLPYVPQVQYTLSVGTEYGSFKQEFSFIYQGESLDQSSALNRRSIPAYGIVDWAGKYSWNTRTQIYARVDNILSNDYLVSLRPFGARPGKPQSFMIGLNYVF